MVVSALVLKLGEERVESDMVCAPALVLVTPLLESSVLCIFTCSEYCAVIDMHGCSQVPGCVPASIMFLQAVI